jgi:hypothetical protein
MPLAIALPTPAELTLLDAANMAVPPIICKAWRRLSSELHGVQFSTKCLPGHSWLKTYVDVRLFNLTMLEDECRRAYHGFP